MHLGDLIIMDVDLGAAYLVEWTARVSGMN
jgi:hypothetical protein